MTAVIGYHASHEQFPPSELLECVVAAEAAGFQAAMCSDHFAPWSVRQDQSGFAWSWLGAALSATSLPMGVVTSPIGLRYHPAIVAQAAATLAEMFPGRFWMVAGSGEALNERVAGQGWPAKHERDARLTEAAEIIAALWAGETVTRDGLIRVENARLYSLPERTPLLIGAALSPATAHKVAGWADGLITVNQPREKLQEIVDAFRHGGGEGKPLYLQIHLSYADTEAEARDNAYDQWRTNALPAPAAAELATPALFDAATRFVRAGDLDDSVRISADPGRHVEWLAEDMDQGFDALFLHNVGRNQRAFIERFGDQVLPNLVAR